MKKVLYVACPALAVLALLAANLASPVTAQVTKGKTRPLTTEQLMEGLVAPNCKALGAALKEGPADEKAWEGVATHAALLNEAGHILMADGRCPDKDWANATKTLRDCSAVVLEKIAAKDTEGAQGAFKAMTQACAACHKAHRKND